MEEDGAFLDGGGASTVGMAGGKSEIHIPFRAEESRKRVEDGVGGQTMSTWWGGEVRVGGVQDHPERSGKPVVPHPQGESPEVGGRLPGGPTQIPLLFPWGGEKRLGG